MRYRLHEAVRATKDDGMNRRANQAESLLEVWSLMRRYRWRFIITAFFVTSGVLAVSLFLPRKYNAQAVFERRTDIVMTEIMDTGAGRFFTDPRQSLVKEIAGTTAVDQILEQLRNDASLLSDLRVNADSLPALRAALTRKINVGYEIANKELDQVRISFIDENPRFARWAVNSLVNQYITQARGQIDQRLRQSAAFFENEAAASRARIEELENHKLVYQIEQADLLPDSPSNIQHALAAARSRLAELVQDREAALVQIRTLEAAITQTPELTPKTITQRNPELDRLEMEHREAGNQLMLCLNAYGMTELHPDVIALRAKQATLKQRMAETEQEVVAQRELAVNPKRDELELQLTRARGDFDALIAQHAGMVERIARMEAQTDQMYGVRSAYLKIDREIAQLQRQLSFWEDNLRRLDMVRAAESGDRGIRLAFVKPCGPLTHPVSPQWMQVLMAAIGLGLVAAAAAVLLTHRTDTTFHRGCELAASLNLPLLGSVSEILSVRQQNARRMRRLVIHPLNFAAMAAVVIFMASLLYLNLERPEVFNRLTSGMFVKGLSAGSTTAAVAEKE